MFYSVFFALFLIFTFSSMDESSVCMSKREFLSGKIAILFSENSEKIDSVATRELISNLPYVLDAIGHKCYIVITPWSCIKETKKDSTIGIRRAKAVADFYYHKYSIALENFFIVDDHHREDFIWMNYCSNNSFVTFNLRFCGKNVLKSKE